MELVEAIQSRTTCHTAPPHPDFLKQQAEDEVKYPAIVQRSLNHKNKWQVSVKSFQQPDVPNTAALKFIMKGSALPFGMVCDVISCLQHKAHELLDIKGVVGKLWMVPERWMVTLRSDGEY